MDIRKVLGSVLVTKLSVICRTLSLIKIISHGSMIMVLHTIEYNIKEFLKYTAIPKYKQCTGRKLNYSINKIHTIKLNSSRDSVNQEHTSLVL